MRTICTLFLLALSFMLLTLRYQVAAWYPGIQVKSFKKWVAGVSVGLSLGAPISSVNANDALDAASKAMLYSSKEKVVVDRAFDSLPEGAKKRKAVALCKDDGSRRLAGYSSASECTTAALSGDYTIVNPPVRGENISPKSISKIPSSALEITSSKTLESSKESRVKVEDFSELSTGQKKRRALAACKRPEVRKFAKAGSESKCSADVNRGNFESVIEALEYGI